MCSLKFLNENCLTLKVQSSFIGTFMLKKIIKKRNEFVELKFTPFSVSYDWNTIIRDIILPSIVQKMFDTPHIMRVTFL